MSAKEAGKKSLSLTTQIIIGLVAGILVGLFFGEKAAWLEVIGSIYVRGLQMTILPYIMFSLMVGFGSLTYARAWLLAKRAGLLLVLFWVVGLSVLVLMTLTFPERSSASFFNPSMVEPKAEMSLLDMFVPSNPFEALATSAIPAVVLFSILFGLALIAIPDKERLLANLTVVSKTLTRVTGFVVKATPLGVFGLMASAAGTLNLDDVIRLQVYFVSYIGCCCFLCFVAFPLIMTSLTPFKYGRVVSLSRDALITAFTTGNLFVVLPLLIHNCQELFREVNPDSEDADFYIDILLPVTFNFPNMGKLTALLFIFFGAWFIGNPLPSSEYPVTIMTGLPVFFGGIDLALPFMLQLKNLPADLFSLYVVSGVINGRFATLLACMELLCFTLVAVSSILGILKIKPVKLVVHSVLLVVSALMMAVSAGALLEKTVPSANETSTLIENMEVQELVAYEVMDQPPELPEGLGEGSGDEKKRGFFDRIFGSSDNDTLASGTAKSRSVLRVGFYPSNLPWSYVDEERLKGFDIEIAHRLAYHLNCELAFYPIQQGTESQYLEAGVLDIVMSGVPVTTTNVAELVFSSNYLQLYASLLIPKNEAMEGVFSSRESFMETEEVILGVINPSPFIPDIKAVYPNLTLKQYASAYEFLEQNAPNEALYTSAEAGSALSMVYPNYKVIIPARHWTYHIAYPLNPVDSEFRHFINQWLNMELASDEFRSTYDFWILGHPRDELKPRWNIWQDVLGME